MRRCVDPDVMGCLTVILRRQVARNICGTERHDPSRRLRSSWRLDAEKEKSTASDREEMMNEERFGFLSPTGNGNAVFADIPSGAVSSYFRHRPVTLPDNDDHLGAGQNISRGQPESGVVDGETRGDTTIEEYMISHELDPASSDDDLLLKPAA